jgi:hypothetical protein
MKKTGVQPIQKDFLPPAIRWIAVGGLLLWLAGVAAGEGSLTEYQVKALFLFNFAKYVDWPAAAFTNAAAPITIGVVGTDPFGDNLENAVAGKTIKGHPFVIKHLAADADLAGCQILFISDSEAARMDEILGKAAALPILTVGEDAAFEQNKGIIDFVLKEGKVRLEIDLTTARKTGLAISSRLLAVADVVKGKPD